MAEGGVALTHVSLCNVCMTEITNNKGYGPDPSCYAKVKDDGVLYLVHKRCGPHNHHSNCECGLTIEQAEKLNCDFDETT